MIPPSSSAQQHHSPSFQGTTQSSKKTGQAWGPLLGRYVSEVNGVFQQQCTTARQTAALQKRGPSSNSP